MRITDIMVFGVMLAIAGAVLSGLTADAAASAGGTFCVREHDARGLAMAGACVSLAQGDAAVHWNPAGLAYQTTRSVTVAHGDVIEDFPSGLNTLSVAFPWGKQASRDVPYCGAARWCAGALVSRLGLDDVADSAEWAETALGGALARTLGCYASAGVSVRYLNVSSEIEEGSAHGFAADVALSLTTTKRSRAAVVMRNALSTLRWKSERKETLPLTVDLAFSYSHEGYGAAELAVNVDKDGVGVTSLGMEFPVAQEVLVLWGGFKHYTDDSPRNVPSFGVGIIPVGALVVSYGASFDDEDVFGTAQRLSVSARF